MQRDNDKPSFRGGADAVVATAERSSRPAVVINAKDNSYSMLEENAAGASKYALLKQASEAMRALGRTDPNLKAHGAAACLAFPGAREDSVETIYDFTPMADLPEIFLRQPDMLGSPGALAVLQALDMIEQKMTEYRVSGVNPRTPTLIVTTDGMWTDPEHVLAEAGRRVRAALAEQALNFAILFIEDMDSEAQAAALALLERTFGLKPLVFEAKNLPAIFKWVSLKLSKAAGGGKFDLPATHQSGLG